ncbi:MAG: PAS domain-containing protein [bacterium]|nr:MAG: PAS domain-containing protein [bacterium]
MQYFNRILIVDDEIDGRKNLEELLIGQGYNLIFADNGYEALAKALELIPDLVLLDLKISSMNGFEVCQQIRSEPVLAEVPIIMIINIDNRGFRLQAIEAGVDDFISKPFDYIELQARVQSNLRLNRYRKLFLERIKFEGITELSSGGIAVIDTQGTIVRANNAIAQMLDINKDNIVQKKIFDFITLDKKNKFTEYLTSLNENSEQIIQAEINMFKSNGDVLSVEFDASNFIWEGKKATQLVIRDITDKKKLEAHLLRAQRMDNIGALSSGIAHDLNNVLTPVLMSLEILKRSFSDRQTHNVLNLMENSLNRGVELVKQILSFGRGSENNQTVVQVKRVILEIEEVLKETFSKLIEIQINVLEELWTVNANITQIHQIQLTMLLLMNAMFQAIEMPE